MTRSQTRRWRAALCALAAVCGGGSLAPAAVAQESAPLQPLHIIATSPEAKPPGFQVTAGRAADVAARVPEVRRERAKGPLERLVAVPGYGDDKYRWQVTYSRDGVGVVEVHVSGHSGRVLEVWTGPQVDFVLARKQKDQIGGAFNKAWVWIPLCVLFVAPFFDPRRPWRLLHALIEG